MYPTKAKDQCFADQRTFPNSGMSGNQTKLTESGQSFYDSGRTDSGFLSGANLVSDQNLSSSDDISTPQKSTCEVKERRGSGALMRLDSGVDVGLCLNEQFSGLSLHKNPGLNDLSCDGKDYASDIIHSEPLTNIKPKQSDCPPCIGVVTAPSQHQPVTQPWELYFQQDEDGDTQLHIAIIQGFIEVVYSLIRMAPHPCFLDILNDVVQSPLHLAVLTHQARIVRQLIVSGANVERRDRHGNTPLHLACQMGDVECVRALTEPVSVAEMTNANLRYPGCSSQVPQDFEEQNYDGEMCVHLAAYGGHIDVLRHLLWFGADINAREGKSGRTILHYAVETSNEKLLQFLLEECPIGPNGLELDTPTYSGHSAYQLAALMDRTVARELVARGATMGDVDDEDHPDHNVEDLEDVDNEIPELGNVYANLGSFRLNGEVLRV